ncbi:MAG: FAD-binding oxidoreductase [Methanoregulaceae archaeon]|nr:FAD-binding oxidoreductase [Methanoregulaceae archaeon]
MQHSPTTLAEWSEAILAAQAVRHSIPPEWRMDDDLPELSHARYADVVEFSPEDLVITVQAGMTLDALQELLVADQRRLPVGESPMPLGDWTLAELLSINPPHTDEFERGGWRDWLLGAKLLMGDGRIIKIGSRAVKNVAGYDVQKLIVGSRGTLAVVLEATLLVGPAGHAGTNEAVPWGTRSSLLGQIQRGHESSRGYEMEGDPWHIQRVSLTDGPLLQAAADGVPHAFHPPTATLWARTREPLPRFEGDWVMRPGALVPDSPALLPLWRRAKEQLDPRGVLNPGYLRL